MVVFNVGGAARPVDQGSWAEIWQAAVGINEMCVKRSNTGISVVHSKWRAFGYSLCPPKRKHTDELSFALPSFVSSSAAVHFQEFIRVEIHLTHLINSRSAWKSACRLW